MGPNNGKTAKLALVPLAKDTVLLPGVTLRIPLANRPDLSNFLASFLNRNKREQGPITLGCIPLASPRLGPDGQRLIEDGSDTENEEHETVDAGQARKEDLFKYGTIAKLIGVQRRVYSEPYLLVEGIRRFSLVRVLRERPFLEAEVALHDEPGKSIRSLDLR
jgi:ATP-dependent Lon protease